MRGRGRGRDEVDFASLAMLDLTKFMRRPQRLPDDLGDLYRLETSAPAREACMHFSRNLLLYSNFEQVEDVALVAVALLQTQYELAQHALQERQSRREFQAAGLAEISRRQEGVANSIDDLRSSFQKMRDRNEMLDEKRTQLVDLIATLVKRSMDVQAADAKLHGQLRHQREARLDLPELNNHLTGVVDDMLSDAETEWDNNYQRILNEWTENVALDERNEILEGVAEAHGACTASIAEMQKRLKTERITDIKRSDLEAQLLGLREHEHDLDLQGRRSKALRAMLTIDAEQLMELCNHALIGDGLVETDSAVIRNDEPEDEPEDEIEAVPPPPPAPKAIQRIPRETPPPIAPSLEEEAFEADEDDEAEEEEVLHVTSGRNQIVDFADDDEDRAGSPLSQAPRASARSEGGRRRAIQRDKTEEVDRVDNVVSSGPRTLPDDVDPREAHRQSEFKRLMREEEIDADMVIEPVVANPRTRQTAHHEDEALEDQPMVEDQVIEAAEDDPNEEPHLTGYEDTRIDTRREDLRESVRRTREALEAREKGLGELRDSLRRSKVSGRQPSLSSKTSQMAHFAEAHSDSSEAIGHEALIRSLRLELENAQSAREEMESEMMRMKTRISRLESDHRRVAEENESLTNELNEEREQYLELMTRAEEELGSVEQTKKQLLTFGRKIEDMTEALSLREDEVERLETELRERIEQLRHLNAQVEQLAERSAALERGVEERDQVIEETTNDLDRRNSQVFDLKEDVERYEERLTDLRQRYDLAIRESGEIRNLAENLRMEIDRRERRIDHLENEVSARADENERISSALVARGEQLTETAEQLGRASEQLENARREIGRLSDELDRVRERADTLHDEYETALETNDRLNHDLREAREEIEHREEEVTRLYDVVESTSNNLQDMQRDAKRVAEEHRRERDALASELDRATERNRNYERERELLRERISNEEEQRHQLLDALQRAQAERKHEQGALMEEIRELRRESSQRFTSMRDLSNRMEELQSRVEGGSSRRGPTERIGTENLRRNSRYESRLIELSDLMTQLGTSATPRERERVNKELMQRLQGLVSEAGGALPPDVAKMSFAIEGESASPAPSTSSSRSRDIPEDLLPKRKPRMVREDEDGDASERRLRG